MTSNQRRYNVIHQAQKNNHPPPTQVHYSVPTSPNVKTKLSRVQPRVHARDEEGDGDGDGPHLDVQDVLVEVGPDGAEDGGQQQQVQQVAAHAVVLPDALGAVDAAEGGRHGPHEQADDVLQQQDDAGGDAEVAVHAVEVARGPLADLVGLDEQHAGGEEDEGEQVQPGVPAGAAGLVGGGPRRLQDEDGLGQGEHAEGLEQRVGAEEGDEGRVGEDAGPDEGDEEEGADLGEPASTCGGGGKVLVFVVDVQLGIY